MTLATALAQAESRLEESARTHKRLEAQHRRQAQADRQALDALKTACREAGITVITQTKESQ